MRSETLNYERPNRQTDQPTNIQTDRRAHMEVFNSNKKVKRPADANRYIYIHIYVYIDGQI